MNAAAAGNDGSPDAAAVEGGVGGFILNDSREIMEDVASMLFGDILGNMNGAINWRVEVCPNYDNDNDDDDSADDEEVDSETMVAAAFQHLSRSANEGGPRIFIGRIKNERTVQTTPILRLVSRHIESGYHSSLGEMDGAKVFDINYSLRGDKFLRGETHETVRFRYNIATDRAIYLISCCTTSEFDFYMAALCHSPDALPQNHPPLHPFSIHLILLFKLVLSRGVHLERLIRMLIAEEEGRGAEQQQQQQQQEQGGHGEMEEIIFGSTNNDNNNNNNNIGDRSALDAAETERHLRRLHGLFQGFSVGENVNRREMDTVKCLLRDLRRLRGYASKWRGRRRKLSSSNRKEEKVQQQEQQQQMFDWLDDHIHQRLIDSFLCLQDFCANRALRLNTRKERTTNLINLRYNLLANHNSVSSHHIAVESAAIAHEARRDTVAMRTIAVLGMLFVPPAFVSGLLGTNLVMLETGGGAGGGGGGSGTRIVVSELWWMYFVLAVPLTGATLGVWLLVMRRSKKRRRLGV